MYRRNEPFRFDFPTPIDCFFTILTPKCETKESNKGEIKMYNLSPKGCSFSSHLKLPSDGKWYITIEATINKDPLFLSGHIAWIKKDGPSTYLYGFQFDEDYDYTTLITNEIKEYAANLRKMKKDL